MKKNIAIIMGGYSSEHGISLKSGAVVEKHLDKSRFTSYPVIIEHTSWYHIHENGNRYEVDRGDFSLLLPEGKIHFDCVFNAIHGTPGEDGLLQAYFELLGIPQTSCGHYQAALTFNKRDLLSAIKPYGIQCAASYFLNEGDPVAADEIVNAVGLPCFVKANRAGSSFGISKVYEKSELENAVKKAFLEDDQVIIESFLEGTEVSVGVITYKGKVLVLPMTEIVSENDFFDYEAKYLGKSQEITPARINEQHRKEIARLAREMYRVLKMKGYTRSEFILVGDIPFLLEMNTTPGLTEESILPQQAKAAGISLEELFGSAIEEALK